MAEYIVSDATNTCMYSSVTIKFISGPEIFLAFSETTGKLLAFLVSVDNAHVILQERVTTILISLSNQ